MDALDKLTGYRACTSAIPPNKGRLARIKSNNYLRNTLALMEAQDEGYDVVSCVFVGGCARECLCVRECGHASLCARLVFILSINAWFSFWIRLLSMCLLLFSLSCI
jgi:hypothetical protein